MMTATEGFCPLISRSSSSPEPSGSIRSQRTRSGSSFCRHARPSASVAAVSTRQSSSSKTMLRKSRSDASSSTIRRSMRPSIIRARPAQISAGSAGRTGGAHRCIHVTFPQTDARSRRDSGGRCLADTSDVMRATCGSARPRARRGANGMEGSPELRREAALPTVPAAAAGLGFLRRLSQ